MLGGHALQYVPKSEAQYDHVNRFMCSLTYKTHTQTHTGREREKESKRGWIIQDALALL